MTDFAGVIYDALDKARNEAIDRQLYTPAERAAWAMAETFADAFDAEHGLGAPELTDDEYRLAVEYDLLGRPDPPDDERPWQFNGAADWWPVRVYPTLWQQDRARDLERELATQWRTAGD